MCRTWKNVFRIFLIPIPLKILVLNIRHKTWIINEFDLFHGFCYFFEIDQNFEDEILRLKKSEMLKKSQKMKLRSKMKTCTFWNEIKIISKVKIRKKNFRIEIWKSMKINENESIHSDQLRGENTVYNCILSVARAEISNFSIKILIFPNHNFQKPYSKSRFNLSHDTIRWPVSRDCHVIVAYPFEL